MSAIAADLAPIRRALLSVTDKTGLTALARALLAAGAELVSTGGTAAALRSAGLPVCEVSDLSGFPEILGGRVKTLVPQVHGGILARRGDPEHMAQLASHGIAPIDLVAVNLYAFEATVAAGATDAACIESIDIGGPALLRAAAKNHDAVTVLSDPAQYPAVIAALKAEGGTRADLRRRLAGQAHARTASYDAAIAAWYAGDDALPQRLILAAERLQTLRYGENPHQRAAFYALPGEAEPSLARARQIQGKPLSFNNLADTDSALACAAEFDRPAIVIVKHGTPCGVAEADTLFEAWTRALAADPVSAFGGVVAANRAIDAATAEAIAAIFLEVVWAPGVDAPAVATLAAKPALRVLLGNMPAPAPRRLRAVSGGLLVQEADRRAACPADLRVVTRRMPSAAEQRALLFAERVAKHALSNAIVLASGTATVGIGAGQTSRVDAVRQAISQGRAHGHDIGGTVLASDAFFPFADGLELAIEAGVCAVIQPGGSVRDAEVIAAADAAGITMVFTGLRHFRH